MQDAFDDMGGISFNVLSLGSIADMLANGVRAKIGTGGIDIGSNLYDLAKRQSDKNAIQNYAKTSGNAEYEAVWNNYIYGDKVQENTSARIADGKDELYFISNGPRGENLYNYRISF